MQKHGIGQSRPGLVYAWLSSKLYDAYAQEIFELFGRAADGEAEHIVPSLAKKAGEVSVAGRENFLATEAEAALASMVDNLSETRVSYFKGASDLSRDQKFCVPVESEVASS